MYILPKFSYALQIPHIFLKKKKLSLCTYTLLLCLILILCYQTVLHFQGRESILQIKLEESDLFYLMVFVDCVLLQLGSRKGDCPQSHP